MYYQFYSDVWKTVFQQARWGPTGTNPAVLAQCMQCFLMNVGMGCDFAHASDAM